MDESMTTKHLTHQIKTRVTHLCVMILELAQAYKRESHTLFIPSSCTLMQENQHIETPHKIVRIKMKQLGCGGMPQDAGLSDFLKNKLQKIAR